MERDDRPPILQKASDHRLHRHVCLADDGHDRYSECVYPRKLLHHTDPSPSDYGPELYSALGYDTEKQLIFSAGYATLALCGNCFNALTIDYVGRVNALRTGWIGDLISLIGVCISVSTFERTGSTAAAKASVTFLFLHIAFFAFNIDVTT